MRKQDTILDEIRRKIDEETKGMTSDEITAYFNRKGEAAAKKYGFRRVASAKETHVVESA